MRCLYILIISRVALTRAMRDSRKVFPPIALYPILVICRSITLSIQWAHVPILTIESYVSTNQYRTTLSPQPDPGRFNVYRIQRPTFVQYADMNFTFNLLAGQPLRLRETITFAATRVEPHVSHIWNNRPFDEGFMGTYVISKKLENDSEWSTISEKIIGKREPISDDVYSFAFSHEWELRLYPLKTDRPTFGSVIKGCNAELRPAAVSNTEITAQNALEYAKILFLLGKKQLGQAASAISQLSQPVTAGYRFPDEVIFRADNQTQIVGLSQGQIATSIGDLWVYLEPDWAILENVDYDIRAIDFGLMNPTPQAFQFPEIIQCLSPEEEAQFPISNQCYVDFQSFLFSTTDAYPSLAQATAGRFLKGLNADNLWAIDEKEWLCPEDNADIYSYWQLRDKSSSCNVEFASIKAGYPTTSVTAPTEEQATAAFFAKHPEEDPNIGILTTIITLTCSTNESVTDTFWFADYLEG
jgi:hypothetical protein